MNLCKVESKELVCVCDEHRTGGANGLVLHDQGRTTCRYLCLVVILSLAFCDSSFAEDWPQFRGPGGNGVSKEVGVPVEWSGTKNVLWKTELPGKGSSSPVILGRRVFLTAFSGYGIDVRNPGDPEDLVRHLICLDRDTGRILWQKDVPNSGAVRKCEGFMGNHGYASHTPVSDGKAIYCWFGSHGAVAFDLDGSPLWQTKPYQMTPTQFGSGASPVLYQNLLLINANFEGRAFVALDKKTGREVWRRERIGSYTTPQIVTTRLGPELIINANNRLAAFDPRTGEELWHHRPQRRNTTGYAIPSPVVHNGTIYSLDRELVAVRAGGRSEVTSTHRLWRQDMFSVVSSPVHASGYIYSQNDAVLTCIRASDGKLMFKVRPNPKFFHVYASPVVADGMIYIIGRYGHSAVVKAGSEFELIAANQIENDKSYFNASPAVSNGRLFIRSQKWLYCIGKEDDK